MIGNIPDGWRIEKLEEMCKTGSGGTPSRTNRDFYDGHIPWIKSGELNKTFIYQTQEHISQEALDKSSAKLVEPETVLLAMYGATVGVTAITKIQAATNQAVCSITPLTSQLENKFLFWFLSSSKKSLVSKSVGGGQPNISQAIIKKILIPLPPLPQQERIVKVLDISSTLIEKQKELIQKYNQFLKSKFLEMFGDPIQNPMGWEMKKLKEISSLISSGNTPKGGSQVYVKEGILFFRSQNVWKNKMLLDDIAYIDNETHLKMKKSSLKHKDILMTKTGRFNTENSSLGRAALFLGEDDSANVNGHVYLIRLKKQTIPEFVVYILTTDEYRDYIRRVCVGGIDKRQINKSHLENFPIVFPPIELQNKFASIVERINTIKTKETQKLEHLEILHKSLVDKAFKGEIQ